MGEGKRDTFLSYVAGEIWEFFVFILLESGTGDELFIISTDSYH